MLKSGCLVMLLGLAVPAWAGSPSTLDTMEKGPSPKRCAQKLARHILDQTRWHFLRLDSRIESDPNFPSFFTIFVSSPYNPSEKYLIQMVTEWDNPVCLLSPTAANSAHSTDEPDDLDKSLTLLDATPGRVRVVIEYSDRDGLTETPPGSRD